MLIETSPDGIIMINTDGAIRFSNRQMVDLFHCENTTELLGSNILSMFAPEERALFPQNAGAFLYDDQAQEGHWLIRKDGSRFFGELRSS